MSGLVCQEVIHKVRMLRFLNFIPPPRLPPPVVHAHTLLAYTGCDLLEKMWVKEINFVNYYQSKNHKQRCKIKKLLYKAVGKCWIKTPRRALRSRVQFLNVRGRWKWIILAIWTALFIYFASFLLRTCDKKLWRTYSYSWTFPLTHTSQYAFSWIVPLLQAYLIYGWPLGTIS